MPYSSSVAPPAPDRTSATSRAEQGVAGEQDHAERDQPKTRINQIALARFEAWALPRMAHALPSWVTPDTLTVIALLSAVVALGSYLLAGYHLAWVHLASMMLVVHWWGDSLDGTLARVRNIQRERYGFYVDHMADAVSVVLIFTGLGASPLMKLPIALGIIVAFLLMMTLVNCVTIARDVFKISFAGAGPTELRLAIIAGNTTAWASGNPAFEALGQSWTLFDAFGLAGITVLLSAFLIFGLKERALLAEMDPPPEPGTPNG